MKSFLRIHQISGHVDGFLQKYCSDVFALGLRVFMSWQFLKSAIAKLGDWTATIELFRDEYQVPLLSPEFAAFAGTAGELIFGALLIAGLFSRLSALGLLLVNIMAVVSYPILWNLDCPAALNDHFYWGILLCVSVVFGAGRISLDYWLTRLAKN
ncbi:DoxX family protein [Undibacterium flavidum]|uniref:DoxX family protein n=1 Tax=Undibacterium flavidum TaxID=2762297 RepID=A0ABR6YHI3_9BURK|nr:DoxX family protein [Undibacterium flavidum]MBC3876045.1 DoxX family protein [Undibacterium flavidum]